MSKNTIIFCYSKSGNTKNFTDQVLSKYTNVEKVDTPSNITDVSQYDFVGFSSGIYYGEQANEITQQIEKLNLTGKKCFFLWTSGSSGEKYNNCPKEIIEKKGGIYLGGHGVKAKMTFWLFRCCCCCCGGTVTDKDIENGQNFMDNIFNQ